MLNGQGHEMLLIILIHFSYSKLPCENDTVGTWIWARFFFLFFFHHTAMKVVAYNPLALQAEHLVLCEVTIVTTTQ